MARVIAACLALVLVGCTGAGAPAATPTEAPASGPPTVAAGATTPTAAPTPTVSTAHIEVVGLTRDYIVVTPPDVDSRTSLPLLLVLHGASMRMDEAESLTGYDAMAVDPGAIVVYPQGVQQIWNAGATDTGVDDVAFLGAIIDRMKAEHPIDPDRVFILGGSNGGQMAYRFACERADQVAAVADVIGALLVDCHPSQPVSVIDIHGTDDTMIPVDGGGQGCLPKACPPLADTMERWRQIDGCAGNPTETQSLLTSETTWTDCLAGTAVTFITAIGQGHDWYISNPDDRAVTWAFFMGHPRVAGAQ